MSGISAFICEALSLQLISLIAKYLKNKPDGLQTPLDLISLIVPGYGTSGLSSLTLLSSVDSFMDSSATSLLCLFYGFSPFFSFLLYDIDCSNHIGLEDCYDL